MEATVILVSVLYTIVLSIIFFCFKIAKLHPNWYLNGALWGMLAVAMFEHAVVAALLGVSFFVGINFLWVAIPVTLAVLLSQEVGERYLAKKRS